MVELHDVLGQVEPPETLEYTGEFGAELVLFFPYCAWLSQAGLARDRKIKTYAGMRTYYEDLGFAEIVEKDSRRDYVHPDQRPAWLPIRNEHEYVRGRSPYHFFPDLRLRYAKLDWVYNLIPQDRPLLIIHNKYAMEWGEEPVNFISPDTLSYLFELYRDWFQIVYIRHGSKAVRGFSEDHNRVLKEFGDLDLLREFKDVIWFDDLFERHLAAGGRDDVNCFKNALYSRAFRFITTQGGGAHHIAMFSGSAIVLLHRRGSELNGAYNHGYYNFMARVPPILGVCRNERELMLGAHMFLGSDANQDRIFLPAHSIRTLSALSPATARNR